VSPERTQWLEPGRPTSGSGPATLVRSVRRHPLLVCLVPLVAVVAALAWHAARSDSYEATAEILVTPAPDDGGADSSLPLLRTSGDRTRIVQTAASLIDSPGAAQRTATALGFDWTPERVDGAVTVEPVGQTDVIAVTAQAGSSEKATQIANTFAAAALRARATALRPRIQALKAQMQTELQAERDSSSQVAVDLSEGLSELSALEAAGDPTLSLTRRANGPATAVGTASWIVLALALVGGLIAGAGAAMVADFFGPRAIADAAEAAELAGAPVLGQVPIGASGRAAVRAARTVDVHVGAGATGPSAVLFAGPTTGEEAAACVARFGFALAQAGLSVLLVDLDGAGDLAGRVGGAEPTDGALRVAEAAAVPPPAERDPYDLVLAFAPSIIESGQAVRAAPTVDAVIVVVRLRHTTADELDLALRLLARVGRRPDGVIVVTGRAWALRSSDRGHVVEVPDPDPDRLGGERTEPEPDEDPRGGVGAAPGEEHVASRRGPRDKRVARRH
jgi:capsular polysaccharide biosynthesis protein